MTIHVSVHGIGKPLVLFHGWGFDSNIWCSLLPALTDKHQVYLVDLPGFGLTSPMDWEMFKATLLKQLPLGFALAGWSMGGLYATRLALEAPQRVTHLLNISSSPHFIKDLTWPGISGHVIKAFYQDLTKDPERILQQFIDLQLQGQTLPSAMLGKKATLFGLSAGLDVLVSWDLRSDIKQLNMPVCYMFGRLDAIMPQRTMTKMQVIYPQLNYILFAKAAHAPFLSDPDEFIRSLEEFIQ